MRFTTLLLSIYPDQGWRLQWDIDGIDNTYEILIERASGPEGPWEEVDVVTWNTVAYTDEVPSYRGFFTQLWYRLSVRLISTPAQVDLQSQAISVETAGTKITNEIIRQHELLLKGVNGKPGYYSTKVNVYKRTKFGTRCPHCISEFTGEIEVDNCDQCKGTRYLEGWSTPIPTYIHWKTETTKSSPITQLGDNESRVEMVFMAAFPTMEPGDILVDQATLEAWEVNSLTSRSPGGYLVSQTLRISQIDRQFIEAQL